MQAAATITIMTTMTINTDRGPLLHLLAWLSPAFPTGGFAYSHGMEWAVEAGDIKDEASLLAWLTDVLRAGRAGPTRSCCAMRIEPPATEMLLRDIVDLAAACAPARERRDEALNQGRAFQLAVAAWVAVGLPDDAPYAVALGVAASANGNSGRRHGCRLPPGIRRQPDLRGRASGAAGPDRRSARSGGAWSQ